MKKLLMAAAIIALAAACAKKEEAPAAPSSDSATSEAAPAADAAPAEPAATQESAMTDAAAPTPCPVTDSRNWDAWTTSDDSGATLHVRGQVDLPTPGYNVTLAMGRSDRMMPPGLVVNLSATPPEGMVTQVITPTDVTLDAAGAYANYRSVTIACGDKKLGEISPVGPNTE